MVHVDDIIPGGTPEFTEMIMNTLRMQFKISKDQARKFTYIGMALRSDGNNIFMNQTQYIKELERQQTEGIPTTNSGKITLFKPVST